MHLRDHLRTLFVAEEMVNQMASFTANTLQTVICKKEKTKYFGRYKITVRNGKV